MLHPDRILLVFSLGWPWTHCSRLCHWFPDPHGSTYQMLGLQKGATMLSSCSAEQEIQGVEHARQALYELSHISSYSLCCLTLFIPLIDKIIWTDASMHVSTVVVICLLSVCLYLWPVWPELHSCRTATFMWNHTSHQTSLNVKLASFSFSPQSVWHLLRIR